MGPAGPIFLMEFAMNRQELIEKLSHDILKIGFKKKDGSERFMKCTLNSEYVPSYEKKTDREKKVNESVLPVYDLEKEGWRSITVDSIFSIEQG